MNALVLIVVNPALVGIVSPVRPEHRENALELIVVTELGIVMLARLVQPSNVPWLIVVKPALVGRVTPVRPVQLWNA